MKIYDSIFLDRDGTLNPDLGYINSLEDFEFFPFALGALKIMSNVCNQFIIVSNQSGISRGFIKEEELKKIHDHIERSFKDNDLNLGNIYFCPDHPNDASNDRKPGTGMFEKAESNLGINLTKSLMVGDARSDIEAGVKLEMDTMLVLTGKGTRTLDQLSNELIPTFIVENLLVGAELVAL